MAKWLLLACILVAGCSKKEPDAPAKVTEAAAPVYDASFWKTWGDGMAELTSYDLKYPRYGAPRQGTAVSIFVSETFANSLRVKSDPGVRDKKDEFPVMKLNLVEDFRTGIYDYNLMLQSFVALEAMNGRPPGVMTKVTWSSQEWCGNLFKEALLDRDVIRVSSHSYFDGEGDQVMSEPSPAAAVMSEDALMLWARGMAWPVVKAGDTREVPALLAMQVSRFKKGPMEWGKVVLSRTSSGEVDVFRAKLSDGRERVYEVEKTAPFRVLKYSTSEGVEGVLVASERMKYWELNKLLFFLT